MMQEFFNFLLPLLQVAVTLLEVFRDSPEVTGVILELFALSAENYIVFLSQVRRWCITYQYNTVEPLIRDPLR